MSDLIHIEQKIRFIKYAIKQLNNNKIPFVNWRRFRFLKFFTKYIISKINTNNKIKKKKIDTK